MVKAVILFLVVVACSTAHAKIVRPCYFNDLKCIGANLAANSNCQRNVNGTLPRKYLVKEFRFETPYFNCTYIDENLIVRNHHKCYVSEFFFNTDTDRAVLAIDCPNLDLESDRVLIQHRSLKEDTYYSYHIHTVYPLIRITVNLPSWTRMNLCKAHVFADVTALPTFKISPNDRWTANYLTRDPSLLDVFERENFFWRGFPLMRIFVDRLICNYGCKPHLI